MAVYAVNPREPPGFDRRRPQQTGQLLVIVYDLWHSNANANADILIQQGTVVV